MVAGYLLLVTWGGGGFVGHLSLAGRGGLKGVLIADDCEIASGALKVSVLPIILRLPASEGDK